jgi:hypothetical protein
MYKSDLLVITDRASRQQSQSGQCGEEKILDPTSTQTLTPSVVQPVGSRCAYCSIQVPTRVDM